MKMTTEEAFVKVLQMHGIEHAFGIIGSAFMPISDLFPKAGVTFWDVAHETNGGLICDGYTRSTGKIAMAIAQNGPGITNFVTAIKTAYWNHTPMLLVTPQAANKTIGQGGFQEVEQMALFRDMVCYQEEVRDASRTAEVLNRVITKAKRLSAPAQINIPRDYWTQVIDITLPAIVEFERPSGGAQAVAEAARLLSGAKFPVILSGAGVVLGNAIPECVALAEKLDAPVCNNYQHNDSFPGSHRLAVGPLGYNGSKAAMELVAKADVVLALGTRLNPFSTLPGYGIDYWPKTKIFRSISTPTGRSDQPVTVGICGDAKLVAQAFRHSSLPRPGMPDVRTGKRSFTRPSPNGCRLCPAWIMKTMIQARPGMRMRASGMRTACRRGRPGGPFRPDCPRMRSSRAISATTALSAMPIRHSTKAGNTWRPGFSGPAVTAFRPSSVPRSAILIRPVSALPVTEPLEFQ
jgi:sulfoacetaldehyde acetyltransferase